MEGVLTKVIYCGDDIDLVLATIKAKAKSSGQDGVNIGVRADVGSIWFKGVIIDDNGKLLQRVPHASHNPDRYPTLEQSFFDFMRCHRSEFDVIWSHSQ